MRDRTKSRNYSPIGEEFRRNHERHRAWGKAQRHDERMHQLRDRPHNDQPEGSIWGPPPIPPSAVADASASPGSRPPHDRQPSTARGKAGPTPRGPAPGSRGSAREPRGPAVGPRGPAPRPRDLAPKPRGPLAASRGPAAASRGPAAAPCGSAAAPCGSVPMSRGPASKPWGSAATPCNPAAQPCGQAPTLRGSPVVSRGPGATPPERVACAAPDHHPKGTDERLEDCSPEEGSRRQPVPGCHGSGTFRRRTWITPTGRRGEAGPGASHCRQALLAELSSANMPTVCSCDSTCSAGGCGRSPPLGKAPIDAWPPHAASGIDCRLRQVRAGELQPSGLVASCETLSAGSQSCAGASGCGLVVHCPYPRVRSPGGGDQVW